MAYDQMAQQQFALQQHMRMQQQMQQQQWAQRNQERQNQILQMQNSMKAAPLHTYQQKPKTYGGGVMAHTPWRPYAPQGGQYQKPQSGGFGQKMGQMGAVDQLASAWAKNKMGGMTYGKRTQSSGY
jgi:hypothetical protein